MTWGGSRIPDDVTVLVVDDDDGIRLALHDLLEGEGFRVETSRNGREALDLIQRGLRPAAILLDLMMPIMDGWAFRAAQLRIPDAAGIPVAVLSASGAREREVRERCGEVEFLPKPVSGDAILAFVGSVIPREGR